MCHQVLNIAPRRPNASHLAGPVGSGFHLTSAGSSCLDISCIPRTFQARYPSKLAVNTSFYLSTSSPSQGGSCDDSTPPVVPSLESTLIELVEDSATKLKLLSDRGSGDTSRIHHKASPVDDGDTNSVLMMGDELDDSQQQTQEEDKAMGVSTGPKLAFFYSCVAHFFVLLLIWHLYSFKYLLWNHISSCIWGRKLTTFIALGSLFSGLELAEKQDVFLSEFSNCQGIYPMSRPLSHPS